MDENCWDEIWDRQVSRGLLLYQPMTETRWVVNSDWFKEVKAEGDRLNNQLEAITTLCQTTLDKKLGGLITQVGEKLLAEKIMNILGVED